MGERAVLLTTPHGNVLWDMVTLVDQETTDFVRPSFLLPSLDPLTRQLHRARAIISPIAHRTTSSPIPTYQESQYADDLPRSPRRDGNLAPTPLHHLRGLGINIQLPRLHFPRRQGMALPPTLLGANNLFHRRPSRYAEWNRTRRDGCENRRAFSREPGPALGAEIVHSGYDCYCAGKAPYLPLDILSKPLSSLP